jgi:hypothetical protein
MLVLTRCHIPEDQSLNIYCSETSYINIRVSLLMIMLDGPLI